MAINAGYMGLAIIGSTRLRFENANIAAKQEVTAPDMVMGDWDHDSYYYGPITIDGQISGPIDESFGSDILTWAVQRQTCGLLTPRTVDIYYYCATGGVGGYNHAQFPQILANSVQVQATAGDVVKYTLNVIGSGQGVFNNAATPQYTDAKKLVTWEKLALNISGGPVTFAPGTIFSAFEIQISNNVTPAYSLGQTNLVPADLITGIRTITGSITIYNVTGSGWPIRWDDYTASNTATLSFYLPGPGTINAKVQFARIQPTSVVGPVTATIAFTGVTHQSGTIWG